MTLSSNDTSEQKGTFLLPFLLAVFAACIGGLIGWFLLSIIVGGIADMMKWDWLETNARWVTMLTVGFLNGWGSFWKHRTAILNQQRRKELGAELGLEHTIDLNEGLSDAIEELMGGDVMISGGALHRDFGSTHLVVADVRVFRSQKSDNASSTDPEYTVAFLEDHDLDLPDFRIQPRSFLSNIVMRMTGFREIPLKEDSSFSKKYILNGMSLSKLKSFFDDQIQDYFAELNGWQIHARGKRVLAWQPSKATSATDTEKFIDQAFEIFSTLRDRNASWTSQSLTNSTHSSAAATEIGIANNRGTLNGNKDGVTDLEFDGLTAGIIRRYLIRTVDIDRMLAEPTPRQWLPDGIKNDKLGFPAVPLVGFMFLAGGTLFATLGLMEDVSFEGGPEWVPAAIGFTFIAVGIPLLIGGCWYRFRWDRLLRRGEVTWAEVQKVDRTGVKLNNQRRYLVTIKYQPYQQPLTRQVAVYGRGGEIASQAAKENRKLHVLYDSTYPERSCLAEGFINV